MFYMSQRGLWSEGYFKGVVAASTNAGISFEKISDSGLMFQAEVFLKNAGFCHTSPEYVYGFTLGLYDSASSLLKSEIIDVFDSSALKEHEELKIMYKQYGVVEIVTFEVFYATY